MRAGRAALRAGRAAALLPFYSHRQGAGCQRDGGRRAAGGGNGQGENRCRSHGSASSKPFSSPLFLVFLPPQVIYIAYRTFALFHLAAHQNQRHRTSVPQNQVT